MSNNHPIDNLLQNTMESLRSLIDVNTIVGDAFKTSDGSTVIPVSKVSMGFASAGTDIPNSQSEESYNEKFPFGGGSGAGLSVKPVAFLVIKGDKCRMVSLNSETTADRLIDSIPEFLEIIKDMGKKKENDKKCCKSKEDIKEDHHNK